MSNGWTAIAFRVPCALRQAQAKPIFQFFYGYSRHHTLPASWQWAALTAAQLQCRSSSSQTRAEALTPTGRAWSSRSSNKRPFSAAVILAAKSRKRSQTSSKSNPDIVPDSKLEAAPTSASHAEGLPSSADSGVLTWRDYDPTGGMPLPRGELSSVKIASIFTPEDLDVDTGNYILSVMHWRRQSGALIDSGLDFPRSSGVTKAQALKGLQYVRTLVPDFDEEAAGQSWVEEESLRLQEEIQERSVSLGIYKREEVEEPETEQGTEYGRQRSAESIVQRHREEREAQWEHEKAEKAAVKEREAVAAIRSQRGPLDLIGGVQPNTALSTGGAGGINIGQAQTQAWLLPVDRKPWVKYYEEQATIIKDNVVPQLSTLRRLGPAFLVMLTVIELCAFVSDNYTPPPRSARVFPDTPPAVATMGTITAALVLGFIASRLPPLWRIYSRYFTIVPAHPHAISIVGAPFRHDTLAHLAANTATLWLFGLLLHEDVGRGTFLAIFFGSGVVGGFSALAYNVMRKAWGAYIFGSSGCVLGVVAAACTLHPNGTVKMFGMEVPVAAWVFLALYAAGEVFAVVNGMRLGIDHAGHFGGMAAGIAWALWSRVKTNVGRETGEHITKQPQPEMRSKWEAESKTTEP